MQVTESLTQKKSLFGAMSRFIGAIDDMDRTVLVPTLLRDVPVDHGGDEDIQQDMYGSFVLLKSIRDNMERGVAQGDNGQDKEPGCRMDEEEDQDLEKLFHFHLNGLSTVLSKLTLRANTLTTRYKEEIGCRN
ncbi:mid1-interacting protein 1-B-like [Cynoglossus semilaevis]|uniref:mid1-interacting protein 1-B-like n=1 Tax=Cynoglossus semilaevis TaxID=244447 RepID=UPI0004959576|nr:mid1-interacting protein 1-B-like [Cynoglossus semilaevis]XP_008323587.1 mid1-interacting protein 1-B-like [Cynoglossus semilaevis]